VSDARPPRLTFPSYEPGGVRILAGGKRAGFALAEFSGWRAYLFPALSDRPGRPEGCEEVTGKTLGDLRRVLRERVAEKGPWWRC
jgi:hypothetical protein